MSRVPVQSRVAGVVLWTLFVAAVGAAFLGLGAAPGRGPEARPDPGPPPESDDPWADQTWLNYHADRACDVVEALTGARFAVRPQVRSISRPEMAAVIATENRIDALEQPEGEREFEPFDAEAGKWSIGMYVDSWNCVYVSKAAMEAEAEIHANAALLAPNVLRLVLVHEAAHALHWQRHPQVATMYADREGDGFRALAATCEGYAQHLTRRAAREWGLSGDFEYIEAIVPGFTYVTGRHFVDGVFDSGGEAAVQALIAAPPEQPGALLNADGWFRAWSEGDASVAPALAPEALAR